MAALEIASCMITKALRKPSLAIWNTKIIFLSEMLICMLYKNSSKKKKKEFFIWLEGGASVFILEKSHLRT